MTVKTETATVYRGGRRRWLSLEAACNAEAGAILSRFCDCIPGRGDMAPETCAMHADHERYTRVRARLAARARRQYQTATQADTPAPESRALAACRELVAATAEVKRLSHLIGENLLACPLAIAATEYGPKGPATHLSKAYAAEIVENDHSWGTHKEWASRAEVLEILSACPHCMAAHEAIQLRKAARQRLGRAKRAVTMIGKVTP